jgi:hypothetical protein
VRTAVPDLSGTASTKVMKGGRGYSCLLELPYWLHLIRKLAGSSGGFIYQPQVAF